MHVQLPPPADGARFTGPLKPPVLVTVTVEVFDDPAGIVRIWGVVVIVRPRTKAFTTKCLAVMPEPPVTVIL